MTQLEFDTQMQELNEKQYTEVAPLKLDKQRHFNEISRLKNEILRLRNDIQLLNNEINEHRTAVFGIDIKIKDINVEYHAKKHKMIIEHPKSETMNSRGE